MPARRRRRRRRAVPRLAAALALAAAGPGAMPSAAVAAPPPNVLVVISDDQDATSLARMPFLSKAPGFTRFDSAFTNFPLCCPSRATFLTGLYSHHTGVESNQGSRFDPVTTLATAFDDAGYETGLFGKYLNGYPFGLGPGHVPPGWDEWVAFMGGGDYYDYTLSLGGVEEPRGGTPQDYSTDLFADHVDDFIANAPTPFFAVFTPYAPHRPFIPAPRHDGAFDGEPVALPPNLNRPGSGAPRFYREQRRVSDERMREIWRRQFASMLGVDEAIERFLGTLAAAGRLDDTIVVFTSDNGFSLGSHRWIGKRCLYEECVRVPLLIRSPQHGAGEVATPVSNVDLAPTLADLAGVALGTVDGLSLAPLLAGEGSSLHRPALLRTRRRGEPAEPPTAWGVRTRKWKYIEYANGHRDLFRLDRDPHELRDLVGRSRLERVRRRLSARIAELRGR